MEQKKMTPGEAWEDFFTWVKLPANWSKIDRRGRDRIGKAQRRYLSESPVRLGEEGIAALVAAYAPGRYVVEVRWVFRKQSPD